MQGLMRLALGGLFLEQPIYREQRDLPEGLRRGLWLVLTVGLVVGLASFIGNLGAALINPAPVDVVGVFYRRLVGTAWFEAQPPALREQITPETLLGLINLLIPGLTSSLVSLIATPLLILLSWLIYGVFAHLMARLLGGKARLNQTLSCTALASGAQLLSLGQIFPVALLVSLLGQLPTFHSLLQALGVNLLAMLGNYLALREAHELPPWRAFWAAILGPALLLVLFVCGYCALLVLALGGR